MEDKKTEELNDLLLNAAPKDLSGVLKENRKYMTNGGREFYDYYTDILHKKHIKLKDVYTFADLSESYGGQIVRMEKSTSDRDLIIRLCMGGHFTLLEMNRALKLYGMRELYAKEPRDACLIVAVNNRVYELGDIDDMLEAQGLKKLSKNT